MVANKYSYQNIFLFLQLEKTVEKNKKITCKVLIIVAETLQLCRIFCPVLRHGNMQLQISRNPDKGFDRLARFNADLLQL